MTPISYRVVGYVQYRELHNYLSLEIVFMIFGLLILVVALTLSTVAAFYSITGLTAIFPGAVIPIIVMGAALEVSKIVSTVWLHKYWDRVAVQFKLYLIPAIAILMLITSMGIFGLLSKSHLDQAVTGGDVSSQVQIFDDKIRTERDNIEAARKALKQMDAQVDAKLARTDDDKGAERAVQIRRTQSKERNNLQNEISSAQKKISSLQEQRAPVASQARKVEAEVGPIRYIAALVYGDNPDANLLEKAVRWVIILIVLVFDPLALVLILAADQTFEWHRPKRRDDWEQVWQPKSEAWPPYEPDFPDREESKYESEAWPPYEPDFPDREESKYELDDGPLTDQQITKIKQEANIDDNIAMDKFFDDGKKMAKAIDDNDGVLPNNEELEQEQAKNQTLRRELEAVKSTAENLKKKFVNLFRNPLKK